MDKFDSFTEILEEMQLRNALDWEQMSREDRIRLKVIAKKMREQFDYILRNIEIWESIHGKLVEVGDCDLLL